MKEKEKENKKTNWIEIRELFRRGDCLVVLKERRAMFGFYRGESNRGLHWWMVSGLGLGSRQRNIFIDYRNIGGWCLGSLMLLSFADFVFLDGINIKRIKIQRSTGKIQR